MLLNKQIFILWLQGWDNAPWLQKQAAKSWEINNPEWKVEYIDFNNLKDYVSDIDYIYDETKNITPQAKSDIIRLSLLKKYGGIWADATLLCMQPLDNWIEDALEPYGFWMYRGGGGGQMSNKEGCAAWFIISEKDNYLITEWKNKCDEYWNNHDTPHIYYWVDSLFKEKFETDEKFKTEWLKIKSICCDDEGQPHCLEKYGLGNNDQEIKTLLTEKPPYVLKLWNYWNETFPDTETEECKNSNGYHAIEMSKRKYNYKHELNC
jgi:hypothetical protein